MARTRISHPSDIKIETSIGKVQFSFTRGDHICVNTRIFDYVNNTRNYYTLAVGNFKYSISTLHLFKQEDGSWATRPGSVADIEYKNSNGKVVEASATAKSKIVATVVPVVNEWLKANPTIAEKAEYATRNNCILELENKVARLTKSMQSEQQELVEALSTLEQQRDVFEQKFPTSIEQLEKTSLDIFKDAIKVGINQHFTEEYRAKTEQETLELEAAGIILGYFVEWSGNLILEIAIAALEECNFRPEAEEIRAILQKLEKL